MEKTCCCCCSFAGLVETCSSCGNSASRPNSAFNGTAQFGQRNGLADTVAHADLLVHFTLGCAVAGCDCDDGHLLVDFKDWMLGRSLADRGCGLDACEFRHVNVHEDEVELFLAESLQCFYARGHHGRNLDRVGKVMLEHAGKNRQVDVIVIHNHDFDLVVGVGQLQQVKLEREVLQAVHAHGWRGRGSGRRYGRHGDG